MNGSDDGVFDLSTEQFDNTISSLIITRPCKIDKEIDFVLIHQAIQRCEIETETSTFAGFYVFGSNDLRTWQLFHGTDKKTGKETDMFCTRSAPEM